MIVNFHKVNLKKKYPLQISRGTHYKSQNLFIELIKDGITAWGESAPGKTEGASNADEVEKSLLKLIETDIDSLSIYETHQRSKELNIPPCAYAAIDIALWDWKAKKAGLPLSSLLGFPTPSIPTSITVGINPPEIIKERVEIILSNPQIKALKIKLGSPDGIEHDKLIYSQVLESTKKSNISIRVDANGGWSLDEAKVMMKWLAERKAEYIEQPLIEGEEDKLKYLFESRPLPIFIDESCRFSEDVARHYEYVDGVNLKLMKCGGITEALRILNVAKSHNLKTMIGCMSESSVSISAGASISGIIDYVDLDSHYNLDPDPSEGAKMIDGITMNSNKPGHGSKLKIEYYA
ncbi:MAG: dipeptide epimerase [Bacteroidetes bacterium]|nr:dipeptide epimerase [Flavobacteriaceae bacterium]MDA0331274.1 dipeptide epimerase [Bacteroidota bacterium]MDA0885857.1 dipeptide epimerase [Bacteroidota bacterium]MDA1226155.1 dipeptide epimerase [Bacteroidota bacterium]